MSSPAAGFAEGRGGVQEPSAVIALEGEPLAKVELADFFIRDQRRRASLEQHMAIIDDAGAVDDIERFPHIMIRDERSEEHTSEIQSLMRISYAVFCLKKNKNKI